MLSRVDSSSSMVVEDSFPAGWAMLPTGVSQRLSPMLSAGMRRSLAGPPFVEGRDAMKVSVVIPTLQR